MKLFPSRFKKNLDKFTRDIYKHEIFTLAGSLAYSTALALAPFILILLSLSSLLSEDLQEKIWIKLAVSVGEEAGNTIYAIIENTKKSSTLSGATGLIGFIILVISASAIFAQLRVALDKINEHSPEKDKSGFVAFLQKRFLSMGLVLGFAFLSIVSLVITTMISVLFEGGTGTLWHILAFAINLILFSVLFMAIYRVIPSDKLQWKQCRVAGLVSGVFYLIGKNIIGLYLAHAGFSSAYGAAGSLVIFLVWVYYTALILLISYEFTKNILFQEDNNQDNLEDNKTEKLKNSLAPSEENPQIIV